MARSLRAGIPGSRSLARGWPGRRNGIDRCDGDGVEAWAPRWLARCEPGYPARGRLLADGRDAATESTGVMEMEWRRGHHDGSLAASRDTRLAVACSRMAGTPQRN